jgi:hypothetical protein
MGIENVEITIEQVRAFIDANRERADVAEYVTSISIEKPLTVETVSAYLGTIEGKNLVQPMIDRANTQAIKTHDEKQKPIIEATVKAKVNEEVQRMNPSETPEQRQIRELRQGQEEMQKTMAKERLDYAIANEFATRGIPLEFAKDIPWPSVEHAVNGALVWERVKSNEIDKEVNKRLSETVKPNGSSTKDSGPNIAGMSKEERFNYFKQQAEGRDAGMQG